MTDKEHGVLDESPQDKQDTGRKPWDIRPYLAVGLTVILVVFVSLLIFFFLFRFDGFSSGVGKVVKSLHGIIFGMIIAYLLNPVMKFFERQFKKLMFTKAPRTYRQNRVIRGLSVTCAMAVFLAVIAILLVLIVPRLVVSVQDLIYSLSDKLNTLMEWIERLISNSSIAEQMEALAAQIFEWVQSWLEEKILDTGGDILTALYNGVYSAVKMVINIIVGLIVAIYILMTKERFKGQSKKIIYAVFKPRAGNIIMEVLRKADDIFGGFLIGKIIDSLIIGFICFGCMYVIRLPYAVLVSVIIGVTNIIPFFGPFIGAIPSVILIFLVSPIQALYFLILVVVLQQVDGNIIGPKILGNSTGLSPFWIIFSILLFGGAFGLIGMICGVPVFALIYYIIKRLVEHFLKKKSLPEATLDYVHLNRINIDTNAIEESAGEKKAIMQPKRGQDDQNDSEK